MKWQIAEESMATLPQHAQLSIAFQYDRIYAVTGSPGDQVSDVLLCGQLLPAPQTKDYDAIGGEGPTNWPLRFDLSNWGYIAARSRGKFVGGAVIAFDTADPDILE